MGVVQYGSDERRSTHATGTVGVPNTSIMIDWSIASVLWVDQLDLVILVKSCLQKITLAYHPSSIPTVEFVALD